MKKLKFRSISIWFVGLWILWFVCWFLFLKPTLGETSATLGQFGDWFGAINALFSSLALAGAIFAVFSEAEARDRDLRNEKRSRVLSLLDAWHSPTMQDYRSLVQILTKRGTDVRSLSFYSSDNTRLKLMPHTVGRQAILESRDALWRVLYFWERVALMLQGGDIDVGDARNYLGAAARGYSKLVGKLLEAEEKGKKDENWLSLLKKIDDSFKKYFQLD